jgi:hypothetical protein
MGNPPAQVNVQVDSLLPMAKGWDEQSADMKKIVTEIGQNQLSDATSIVTSSGGMVYPGVGISQDYPLFTNALNAYGQVVTEYSGLCQQGAQMMEEISEALTTSYHNYQSTESANVATVNNVG